MATKVDAETLQRIEEDEKYRRELSALFKDLRSQAISNGEYFKDGKGVNYERFSKTFRHLYEHLDRGIEPGVEYLLRVAHLYDFDPQVPGNGYRSFVKIIHKCCTRILQVTRHVSVNRDSFLFRAGHYSREIDAFVTTLGQLRACLYYLQKLLGYCREGELFPDQDNMPEEEYRVAEQLMMEVESLSQETFYGRCLGFQFCDSMVKPLTTITLAMASFADGYQQNSTVMKLATSILGGGKYVLDPEMRAAQVVNKTRDGDIRFCKSFWSIAESNLMHQIPLFVCPSVQLDKVIRLHPDVFELPLVSGTGTAKVTPPCAHSGPGPVSARLISYELREGQELWKVKSKPPDNSKPRTPQLAPKSPCLLLHCHGGGFVAQSSASHEVYLRHWAKDLNIPIFSIDYSLAPEHPFPRQLEEVFFAYCWAIRNAHLLGWTGERICIAGDSAGGNLSVSVSMRAASMGIRIPDGILSVYGTVLIRYTPSPARLISLMDPLLPIGLMSSCLAAYSGMTAGSMLVFPYESISPNHPRAHRNSRSGSVRSSVSDKGSVTPNIEPVTPNTELVTPDSVSPPDPAIRSHPKLKRIAQHNASGDSGFQDGSSDSIKSPYSPPESSQLDMTSTGQRDKLRLQFEYDEIAEEDEGVEPISPYCNGSLSFPESPSKPSVHHVSDKKTMMRLELDSPADIMFHSAHSNITNGVSPGSPMRKSKSDLSLGSPLGSPPAYAQIRHFAQSPVVQFRHMPIAKNPYMSPYLAREDMMEGLPPVHLIACHLDPMLDDSVMFAKRLKALGKEVHMDIVHDLPHGFLNFVLVSREAKQASDLCVQRIRDMLHIDTVDLSEYEILDKSVLEEFDNGEEDALFTADIEGAIRIDKKEKDNKNKST